MSEFFIDFTLHNKTSILRWIQHAVLREVKAAPAASDQEVAQAGAGPRLYSGVPASLFGEAQRGIRLGDATSHEKLGDSPTASQGAL